MHVSFLLNFFFFFLAPLTLNFVFVLKSVFKLRFISRRICLIGDMANLYPFIQSLLNDHLVSYFPLMYHYGINTSILHLTFSRAGF